MPTFDDRPQTGDAVWVESRKGEGKQPNGVILDIDEDEDVCIVQFELTHGAKVADTEQINLFDLEDNWTDKYGGMWYVESL
jgi:hypothetical protein